MTQRFSSPYRTTRRSPRGSASRTRPRDPARRVAYDVLYAVQTRDAYANLLLPVLLRERGITGRDAGLATELTYGTLRLQGSYDAVLDACVDRSLRSVDTEVLPLLRMGAHQLLSMDVPPHAAVSSTVDLARRIVGHHRARFVNAVLRKVTARDLTGWLSVLAPDRKTDPVGHLAITHSHPRWVVQAFAEALGDETSSGLKETERLLTAHNERPRVTLLAKPGRATVTDLVDEGAVAARYSPYGAVLPEGDPGMLRLVRQGRAVVQDEASQLVALALSRVPVSGPDQQWLDMCAGPGGKAALMAGLVGERGGRLLAAEVQPARAGLVARAVHRSLGNSARVIVADSTQPPWRDGIFDRVLVDAPCTGLGALRRRPESRWRRRPHDLETLIPLQTELLGRALDLTRAGGVVAYATCSPHRAETVEVVDAVVSARTDVTVEARHQWWPHLHGTDAMFCALLRRG